MLNAMTTRPNIVDSDSRCGITGNNSIGPVQRHSSSSIHSHAQAPLNNTVDPSVSHTRRLQFSSSRYDNSEDLVDIEYGGMPSLKDQSKRLSETMQCKSELYGFRLEDSKLDNNSSPQLKPVEREETSGLKYWKQEIDNAKQHGGDLAKRSDTAVRAALGSFLLFAVLIFPHQNILNAVWIGNIFMHATIADSLGASIAEFRNFASSIIFTSALSLPVACLLARATLSLACILLPFLVFILSFVIMSSPQLSARNLMILVMYIDVATVVREEIGFWEPFGWVATYVIGLSIAVLMNLLPTTRLALTATSTSLGRLEKDLTMLLLECKAYANNTAQNSALSRSAIAAIEMLDGRISHTTKMLGAQLAASQVELSWHCQPGASKNLDQWVKQVEKLRCPLKSLRTALQQRVLGEDINLNSTSMREIKTIIREDIRPARDRMVDAMIASVAVCQAWADPLSRQFALPDVEGELAVSIFECRKTFHRTISHAVEHLLRAEPQQNTPIFAHLTRRMSAFNALFEFGDSLLAYLEQHRCATEVVKGITITTMTISDHLGWAYWNQPWLWHKPDSFRLALKTSVGMALASLFVAVPFLWRIASPFGVWPGLTIASINLVDSGSSFHKAFDRLFGTLLAAAYALLVSDLFTGNYDFIKIPAIALFTYVLIYLRDAAHAYRYTYAATSIGSMLYGSVKNDFNIAGYIPKRIELIFLGVVIFTFVELLLFPRSSRKLVESLAFEFFGNMSCFMKQAAVCTLRVEEYVHETSDPRSSCLDCFDYNEYFQLDKLTKFQTTLKQGSIKLQLELESGLDEPHVGLSLPLDAVSFRGLVKTIADCEFQSFLLLKSLQQLVEKCQKDSNQLRELNWPHIYNKFLTDGSREMEYTCECLRKAYPDGRLRPQEGNSLKAIAAAASFRGFEDVRLGTISNWSEYYSKVAHVDSECDPLATMMLGIVTTYFLELCRQLQKAGRHVEHIAHHFPPSK